MVVVAAISGSTASASGSSGPCANERSSLRAAAAIETVDSAELQIDYLTISLRKALLASDRDAGDASAVRADLKRLAADRRRLALDRKLAAKDVRHFRLSRGVLQRCMATRQG